MEMIIEYCENQLLLKEAELGRIRKEEGRENLHNLHCEIVSSPISAAPYAAGMVSRLVSSEGEALGLVTGDLPGGRDMSLGKAALED